jgi:hypothetical protein
VYFVGMKTERLFGLAGQMTHVEELRKGFEEGALVE